MNMKSILGTLISISTLCSCAPVASSSPKLSQSHPRGDSGLIDSRNYESKFDLAITAKTEIVSAEKYDTLEKKYSGYKLEKYEEKDSEISELLETRSVKDSKVRFGLERIEIVTIFIVDVPEKYLDKEKNSEIKVDWLRGEKLFSFSIDKENTSPGAWTFVKKNLIRVTIAYRAVKADAKK